MKFLYAIQVIHIPPKNGLITLSSHEPLICSKMCFTNFNMRYNSIIYLISLRYVTWMIHTCLVYAHTHTHSLSLTHTHSHTLSLSFSFSHTHSLSHLWSVFRWEHQHPAHTHTHTHAHTHTLSLSLSHTHKHKQTKTHTHTHARTHAPMISILQWAHVPWKWGARVCARACTHVNVWVFVSVCVCRVPLKWRDQPQQSFLYVTWFLNATWLIHIFDIISICDMTPSYITQKCPRPTIADTYVPFHNHWCEIWLIPLCDKFLFATQLIHICDITPICDMNDSYVGQVSKMAGPITARYTCAVVLSCMCDMTQILYETWFLYAIWLIHICDLTQKWRDRSQQDTCVFLYILYVWHDSFLYVTWLIPVCDMNSIRDMADSYVSLKNVGTDHTGRMCAMYIHVCVMWHILICDPDIICYTWHDSFLYVTWLIHTWLKNSRTDHSRIYVCPLYNHVCVTWLIPVRDMTHSCTWHDYCMWHDSFIHVTSFQCVCACVFVCCFVLWCHMTHSYMPQKWRDQAQQDTCVPTIHVDS